MANGIRTGDSCGFNKRRSSKFPEGSRVRQTPEEGQRKYQPKLCGNNNKDEDDSPKNLNDKNQLFLFNAKNSHIIPPWLFNAKAILVEEQQSYYLTHNWKYSRGHNFLRYMSKGKLAIVVEGNLKAPFSITTTPNVGESASPFPGLTPIYPL